jgi:TRAP-type C4-dicarboxylate transport system permease small subunit
MVWLIFIGASQVTQWGGHVAVDIVPRVLSKRGNAILAFAVNLICILFCMILAYLSLQQMLRVMRAGQISPALEIPMWIAYLSIPAGTILMLIRFLQQFWRRIQGKTVETREVLD